MSTSTTTDKKDSTKDSKEENKVRAELLKWNAVVWWQWEVEQEKCAICRNLIMEECIECQANQKGSDNSECQIAWGVCNHTFHLHCIQRWLKTRTVCPLDNQEWELLKYSQKS
eukprot:TRINITY_DN200_c0_g1_i1.p1 TRINITY_DN200_c0_g1~~TRINITY_DN200_c0_g1_i1.p1  ORF type:complete len:113 (+),score=10.42 TRINITY_DN200_c0_g1_i1:85-423(+)